MLTHLGPRGVRAAALRIAAVGLHMMLSLLYSNDATRKNWNTGWEKKVDGSSHATSRKYRSHGLTVK